MLLLPLKKQQSIISHAERTATTTKHRLTTQKAQNNIVVAQRTSLHNQSATAPNSQKQKTNPKHKEAVATYANTQPHKTKTPKQA
ncbi:MAG: hypothetical protein ACQCN4_02360 [Candidatus Bathyarchaeia archaeon]